MFKSFAHGVTGDPGELMESLRGARRATEGMRWCRRCERPEPKGTACPDELAGAGPADPFEPGSESGVAARILYDDMIAAGIPLSSVERIIALMLAELVRQAPGG